MFVSLNFKTTGSFSQRSRCVVIIAISAWLSLTGTFLFQAPASLSDPGVQVEEKQSWEIGAVRADPNHEVFYSIDLTGGRIVATSAQTGIVFAERIFASDGAEPLDLEGGYFEFSLDGSRVYYSVPLHSKIFAFETVTLEPLSQIDTPFPVSTFVIMKDGNFYVRYIDRFPEQFAVLDPSTGQEATTPSISLSLYDAQDTILRRNRDGSRFFFKKIGTGNIYELALSRHIVAQKTKLHNAGGGGFAFDEINNQVLTVNRGQVAVHSLDENSVTPLYLGKSHLGEDIKINQSGSKFYSLANGLNGKKYLRMFSLSQQIAEAEWAFSTVDGGIWDNELRYQTFDILPSGNLVYRCEKDEGNFYLGLVRTNLHAGSTAPTVGGLIASQGYHTDKIKLMWAPIDGATSYVIYRSEIPTNNFSSTWRIDSTTSTSYTDHNLDENRTYYYWVKSRSSSGILSDHNYFTQGYTKTAPPSSTHVNPSQGQYLDRIELRLNDSSFTYSHTIHVYRSTTNDFSSSSLMASIDSLEAKFLTGDESYSIWTDSEVETGEDYYYWTVWENEEALTEPRGVGYPAYLRDSPPLAASGLHASDGTFEGEVKLVWHASRGARTYQILRNRIDNVEDATTILTGITGTRATDTTSTEGASYYYWVVAENEFGNSNPSSSDVGHPQTLKPITPISLTASKQKFDDKIEIEWEAAPNAITYDLYRSETDDPAQFELLAEGISNNVYHDLPPLIETPYYYSVIAKTEIFQTDFSPTDYGVLAPPGPPAPQNVTATQGTDMFRIDVTWDAVDGVSIYHIFRNTENDFSSATFVTQTTTLSYSNINPPLDQEFHYWIVSYGYPVSSDPSLPAVGYAVEHFLPVTEGVTATQGTDRHEVTVSWNPVPEATGYAVFRNTVESHENATQLVSHSRGTSFRDLSAIPDTTYYYFVQAVTSRQRGIMSDPAVGFLAPRIPDAATNLSVTKGDRHDYVKLDWSQARYAEEYIIQRSLAADGPYKTIGETTTNFFEDHTTNLHTEYYYRVIAKNSKGSAAPTAVLPGYRTHPAPTSVEASKGYFQGVVVIIWDSIPGATDYQILRGTTTDPDQATIIGTTSDTGFIDDTGDDGKRYVYFVRTITAELTGPTSYSRGHGTIGPPYQPDTLIGKSFVKLKGNNNYRRSSKQQLERDIKRGRSASFYIAIENDGETQDVIVAFATKGNRKFRPIYRVPGQNVTSAISTYGLAGEFYGDERAYIKLRVRTRGAARRPKREIRKTFSIRALSYINPTMQDSVRATATTHPD